MAEPEIQGGVQLRPSYPKELMSRKHVYVSVPFLIPPSLWQLTSAYEPRHGFGIARLYLDGVCQSQKTSMTTYNHHPTIL